MSLPNTTRLSHGKGTNDRLKANEQAVQFLVVVNTRTPFLSPPFASVQVTLVELVVELLILVTSTAGTINRSPVQANGQTLANGPSPQSCKLASYVIDNISNTHSRSALLYHLLLGNVPW